MFIYNLLIPWFALGLFKVLGLVLDDSCGLIFVLKFIVFCLASLKLLQMDFMAVEKIITLFFFKEDQRARSIQVSSHSAAMWLSKNIA